MIHINCPNCKHTRIVNEDNIPPSATMATCPKCKHRFNFRRIDPIDLELAKPAPVLTPTSTEDFNKKHADIWDAIDSLNKNFPAEAKVPAAQPEQAEELPAHPSGTAAIQASRPDAPALPEHETMQTAEQETIPEDSGRASHKVEPDPCPAQGNTEGTVLAPPLSMQGINTKAEALVTKQQVVVPVFPYANDDTPPEERVERDLLLLQASDSRPVKDLGNLLELSLGEDTVEDLSAEVPWEYPEKTGWILSFVATVKEVMFNSPLFFASMPKTGALGFSFLFFLIQGYIAVLCTVLWRQLAAMALDIPAIGIRMDVLPMLLLLFPVVSGCLLALSAGVTRVLLEIASKNRCNLPFACRLFSYAAAPFLVSLIPFVGPLASALWVVITIVIACRYACSLSWVGAFFSALPGAAILLGGLFWFFI